MLDSRAKCVHFYLFPLSVFFFSLKKNSLLKFSARGKYKGNFDTFQNHLKRIDEL